MPQIGALQPMLSGEAVSEWTSPEEETYKCFVKRLMPGKPAHQGDDESEKPVTV